MLKSICVSTGRVSPWAFVCPYLEGSYLAVLFAFYFLGFISWFNSLISVFIRLILIICSAAMELSFEDRKIFLQGLYVYKNYIHLHQQCNIVLLCMIVAGC